MDQKRNSPQDTTTGLICRLQCIGKCQENRLMMPRKVALKWFLLAFGRKPLLTQPTVPDSYRVNKSSVPWRPVCLSSQLESLDGDCSPCDSSSASPQDRISEGSDAFDFPSLTTSGVAHYAKRRLSVDGLPTPGSTDATYACALRLKRIVRLVERNRITKNVLLDNLEYAIQVVEKTYMEETSRRLRDEDDDLSDAACSEVPDEVRDWLSSTFKRNAGTGNLNATKPHFR
ncbi:unnamed protein product, partial [Dibothriocephalus latus]